MPAPVALAVHRRGVVVGGDGIARVAVAQ